MNKIALLVLTAFLGISSLAQAEAVYKYTVDGKVIYSDQPPPGADAKRMDSYSSSKPDSRPTSEATADEGDQFTALRSSECKKAQERLKQYQDSPTLIQRNLKGEQVTLSASERLDVIVRAQQDADELCGPPPAAEEENDDGFADLDAEVEILNE